MYRNLGMKKVKNFSIIILNGWKCIRIVSKTNVCEK